MLREQFKENCPHRGVGILTCRRKPLEGEYKLVAIERFNHEDQRSDAPIGFDNIHVVCAVLLLRKGFAYNLAAIVRKQEKSSSQISNGSC